MIGTYLILCGAFCCIGGLFAWGLWQSKNIMRLEFLYEELVKHVMAHDEHLDVHDKCWTMQRNRMNALARVGEPGRVEEHGPMGSAIRSLGRNHVRSHNGNKE